MKKTELAYLAGLWDGEGSITTWKTTRNDTGRIRIIPTTVFTNTDEEIVDWVEIKLKELGMVVHRISYDRPKSKRIYQLTCRNFESVKLFLAAITPYLKIKQKQAKLTLQFVKGRLKRYRKKPRGWNKLSQYTDEEFNIVEEVTSLNRRGRQKEKVQRL